MTHHALQYLHGDRRNAADRLGAKLRESMPSKVNLYRSMGLQLHIDLVRSYVRVCPAAITVVVQFFRFRQPK